MQLSDYQSKAFELALYPGHGTQHGLAYVALGLGEAGEVQNKVKKVLRGDPGAADSIHDISNELGDLLWYVAAMATELGISLDDIASENLCKLDSRAERGVLCGSGDNR